MKKQGNPKIGMNWEKRAKRLEKLLKEHREWMLYAKDGSEAKLFLIRVCELCEQSINIIRFHGDNFEEIDHKTMETIVAVEKCLVRKDIKRRLEKEIDKSGGAVLLTSTVSFFFFSFFLFFFLFLLLIN